jgi:hypothetical protein
VVVQGIIYSDEWIIQTETEKVFHTPSSARHYIFSLGYDGFYILDSRGYTREAMAGNENMR